MNSGAGKSAGFTLIEILVAFAILALGLTALVSVFSTGLRRTDAAATNAEATEIAQSVLARVGADIALVDGDLRGASEEEFNWHVAVRPYGDAATARRLPVEAHQVAVTVSWGVRGEHSLTLRTLRLAVRN